MVEAETQAKKKHRRTDKNQSLSTAKPQKKTPHKKVQKHTGAKPPARGGQSRKRVKKNQRRSEAASKKAHDSSVPAKKRLSPKKIGLSKKKRRAKRKNLRKELTITGAVFLILLFIGSLTVFSVYKQEGYSMTQTLRDKDQLFVNRLGVPRRYSLVLFREPQKKELSIRRIIGLPGETVSYKEDELYINTELKSEFFLADARQLANEKGYFLTDDFSTTELPELSEGIIPEKSYFVMGDNRQFSTDSRHYGVIQAKDIVGVVTMRLLPLHKLRQF
ncbi:signal peptidase I [Enterococcus sp. LJL128]